MTQLLYCMLEMTGTIQNWTGFKFFRKLFGETSIRAVISATPYCALYFRFLGRNLLHKQNVLFFGTLVRKHFYRSAMK